MQLTGRQASAPGNQHDLLLELATQALDALLQARDARLEILDVMNGAIAEPRDEVADGAPRVEIVHIPQDKIGAVIGPRGAIIKELVEETGAQIDVDEEGGGGVVNRVSKAPDHVDPHYGLSAGVNSFGAWSLAAVASNRGPGTSLADVEVAVQTELPTTRAYLSDQLWGRTECPDPASRRACRSHSERARALIDRASGFLE